MDTKPKQTTQNTPENLREALQDLGSKNFRTRLLARDRIVKMGKDAIDFLAEYITHPQRIYRMEAVKALSEINDPLTIPLLLEALYDEDPDIRWVAAEGLIKLGRASFIPILELVTKDAGNLYVRRGAYHVLHHLRRIFPYQDKLRELLRYLQQEDRAAAASDMAERIFELLQAEKK